MTETQWTAKIVKDLRSRGIMVRTIPGDGRGGNGWPDRVIVTSRGVFLVEFKGEKTKIEPLQQEIINSINRLTPATAFVARKNGTRTEFYYNEELVFTDTNFLRGLYTAYERVKP